MIAPVLVREEEVEFLQASLRLQSFGIFESFCVRKYFCTEAHKDRKGTIRYLQSP
jgi:hypothetical protein